MSDRIKEPLLAFIRTALSRVDFMALYESKVVSQTSDGAKLDVQPVDPRIPGLKNVPLRNGLPGTVCKFSPGQTILLGWSGGDPKAPYVTAYGGGEMLSSVEIGSSAEGVATKKDLQVLFSAITNAGVTPNDGGATLKANIITALTTALWSSGSTDGKFTSSVVKVQR